MVWLKHDLPAGLSVFFVALPLCLGISLASGAPLSAGLLSGIIGGLVVSFISGSELGVSGPAAGLTTLVAATIVSAGDFRVFLLSVIIAGAFQLLLGLLKLGTIASFFPSAVINGMLAAIGIILVSKQIPIALGYDQPDFWSSGFLHLFSNTQILGNLAQFKLHITTGALIISSVSIVLLTVFQLTSIKKKIPLPPALVVVIIGILVNWGFSHFAIKHQLKTTQLVNISISRHLEKRNHHWHIGFIGNTLMC
jgi:MFS superfamily sulfate permease-like transporter